MLSLPFIFFYKTSLLLMQKINHQGGCPGEILSSQSFSSLTVVVFEDVVFRHHIESSFGKFLGQNDLPDSLQSLDDYPVDIHPSGASPITVGVIGFFLDRNGRHGIGREKELLQILDGSPLVFFCSPAIKKRQQGKRRESRE
ncbi:MAG: hypothetical protein ACD_16C00005G0002 [uncultured bacterium]|nr:MAG: hypothetical protein ACD_16C00005G0002 [uncultured bacterium]